MAESASSRPGSQEPPLAQRLLDNVFVLLIAGMVVPTIFYLVLGVLSLLRVKAFPL
ncbi:MAG: hypothetical protein U0821_22295 [Chloroflexota bacterium]